MAMQSNACSSSASAMTSNFIRNASKKYEKRAVGVTDSQVCTQFYLFILYCFQTFVINNRSIHSFLFSLRKLYNMLYEVKLYESNIHFNFNKVFALSTTNVLYLIAK